VGVTASARLADAVKRHHHLHRAVRRARYAVGRVVPPRRYEGIPGRVHFNDYMFVNGSAHEVASYAERAQNVIALIEETLEAAGRSCEGVERWLDFGCGYGRVIRFLVERVQPERVFASDIVREGAQFCQSEFGVTAVSSYPDLSRVQLGRFDFIYAISVITHLNERNSVAFLRLLGDSLSEGGIAMFTTHGQWSLEHPELYGSEYEDEAPNLVTAVREHGTAYVPYPFERDDYGMTWHSREFIEGTMAELHGGQVAPVLFKPHGLDGHQDVYAFMRARAPA
jgi:SAM-dependent methyltransferase